MSYQRRYWVRYISKWTHDYKISSFDSQEEAEWFASQVDGTILDWK